MKNLEYADNRVLPDTGKSRQMLRCPACGKPILIDDGEKWKLKTRIVIFLNDKTLAKCKYCRNDVQVPVEFNREALINGDFNQSGKELAIEP
ncbi:MAG: hypothetical protein KAJ66_05200 [Candidatus Omnitrophica bacterium]|nr:hypothetical protein [Candidatus Omnitrophota bacterium]